MEGTLIGQYRIERMLGQGGFGVVYLAVDTRLGRRAAIKQLLPELTANRPIVERFFNEAKAAATIDHPGIVEIYDVGWHTDGSAYFAMKLLDGDSVAKRLRESGPLAVPLAISIARQVASALAAAHARGIVHRDLKPDNVILVPDAETSIGERAVVLDFGIAKLFGDKPDAHKTRTGMLMGTPAYMSPEQCRGAGEVDHRTDVYALGCMIFELLAGRPPFVGSGPGEVMGMHQFFEPPSLGSLRPDTPAALDALVARMLAKQPEQRFADMTEVAAVLAPFTSASSMEHPAQRPSDSGHAAVATDPGVVAARPLATPVSPAPRSRRRLGLAFGGVAIAGGAIALVALAGGGDGDAGGASEGDQARLDGPIDIRLGDCAGTGVSFVSGPRPEPFDASKIEALQAVARTDVEAARAKDAHERAVAKARETGAMATAGRGERIGEFPVLTTTVSTVEADVAVGVTGPSFGPGGGRSSTELGTIDVDPTLQVLVRRYVRRELRKVDDCYKKALATRPGLRGTLVVEFLLTPAGRVKDVRSSGMDASVSGCVTQVLAAIELPSPRIDEPAAVKVPFTWEPPVEEPAQAPAPTPRRTTDYVAGTTSSLRGLEAQLVECFRLQDRRHGVAVIDLGTGSPVAHGIDSQPFKECVARLAPAVATPTRCSVAFGAMPVADARGLDITADAILLDGEKLEDLAALQQRDSWGIDSVRDRARDRVLAALTSTVPVVLHGPLIVRPVDATPMKIVHRVIGSAWASGEMPLLAAQDAKGWKLLRAVALPIVPVPIKSGTRWPMWKSKIRGGTSEIADTEPKPKLCVLVTRNRVFAGVSRIQEIATVETVAQLPNAIATLRSHLPAGEKTLEIAADEDLPYRTLVEAIEVVNRLGFTEWELTDPMSQTMRFTL